MYDLLSIPTCIFIANWFYFGSNIVFSQKEIFVFATTTILSIVVFIRLGFYRAILRYIGTTTVTTLLLGISISALIYGVMQYATLKEFSITLSVFYWALSILAIGGSRLAFKAYIQRFNDETTKVAIYGAGAAGRQLASALRHGSKYWPVVFIDDDTELEKAEIEGVKVYSPSRMDSLIEKYKFSQVFLALPSTSHSRRSDILEKLEHYPVKVKTIAGMEDIVTGKASIDEIKELDIEDLLGRDSVKPDKYLLEKCITGKVVMVTGAGGSIGSELCRQILSLKPKSLLLYELSEYGLYAIERELKKKIKKKGLDVELVALLGSVQHKNRLTKCMKSFGVQTVYHAAAYKHVPIVEHNIVEGIRNNVFGTLHAAEAAVEANVEKFVLISTDKAVRPTNVMGASKRVAELVLQSINERQTGTIFTMVRFGNVLGSSGSVVPLFREQIKSGGPVTVTHQDIIRYFMTIPEAAQLVIQAGAMGKGGDVFVLDMGEPVKISSLAEKMVHLMGRSIKSKEHPNGDIEIKYTGLRPGEKLYEELLIGENVEGTDHPRIMSANEEYLSWKDMNTALNSLDGFCHEMDCESIVQLLLRIPTGYNPQHAVCDLLWEINQSEFGKKEKVVPFKTLS